MNPLTQPVTPKTSFRIVAILLISATLFGTAWLGWRKYQSRTLTVAETRKAIRSYLHKQSGVNEFKPTAAEPSTNSAAADDDSKKQKQKRKSGEAAQEKLTGEFRRSVGEATDYRTIYRLIGENLARVDLLLSSNTVPQTETATLLAADACRVALDSAVNGWLSARIAEGYLWPQVDFVEAHEKDLRRLDTERLLDVTDQAFKAAGESKNVTRNYRLLIAKSNRGNKADQARFRLGRHLEDEGDFAGALQVLQEVTVTNNAGLQRRIASLQQQQAMKQK
jgi:hypothetical protein